MFDPKVLPDQCTDALCSYSGVCRYDLFVKKYYCDCSPGRGGFNCTFKNVTELLIMKNYTLELAKKYQPLSLSGRRTFDYEFLNLVTSSKDLMSDDTFDAIQAIVKMNMTNAWANVSDPDAKKAELANKMEGMIHLTS